MGQVGLHSYTFTSPATPHVSSCVYFFQLKEPRRSSGSGSRSSFRMTTEPQKISSSCSSVNVHTSSATLPRSPKTAENKYFSRGTRRGPFYCCQYSSVVSSFAPRCFSRDAELEMKGPGQGCRVKGRESFVSRSQGLKHVDN